MTRKLLFTSTTSDVTGHRRQFAHYAIAATSAAICLAGCFDSTPKDEKLLRNGNKFEIKAEYDKAFNMYTEAAALGNADAFKKLGDLVFTREIMPLSPANPNDYVSGYDEWLNKTKPAMARANDFYNKAQMAGCTNQLDASMKKMEALSARIKDTEARVNEAKELKRQEELRKQEEARLAELRRQEELRRKQEEERRLAEEAARRAKAEAEEKAHRESPEYCIENGLTLTDAAFSEIVKADNYVSRTGNKLYDKQVEEEQHARFRGKHLVLEARVDKVESTFFTDEVKIVLSRRGGTISARFDGMSKAEAANISVGTVLKIEGDLSMRPVLSSIAMDRCRIL